MALLIRLGILSFFIFTPFILNAASRPLVDFYFHGYIQGRLTGFIINTNKPQGPLNNLAEPNLAGGESETVATIKRLDFALGTQLPISKWSIHAQGSVGGYKVEFIETYLKWTPTKTTACQIGIITVPFGLENQQPSCSIATTERALIYNFGNFSWSEPIGFQTIDQYDYGVRFDFTTKKGYAGFKPFFQTAVVTGNGRTIQSDNPTQLVARIGATSKLAIEHFRHELNLACSGSLGWNKFEEHDELYMPIGSTGDIYTNPDAAIPFDHLGLSGRTSVFGTDLKMRMNDFVLSCEWLIRQVNNHTVQGYYFLGQFEFLNYIGSDIELVLKWEEAYSTYADGSHFPGQRYQAATVGINWNIDSNWQVQLNYITILTNLALHQFTGSDLIITQLQWSF